MGTVKNSRKIRVESLTPLFNCEIRNLGEYADAGVIYEYVQRAELLFNDSKQTRNIVRLTDIGGGADNVTARPEFTERAINAFRCARADCDRGAGIEQHLRDRPPNAARTAGYNGKFTIEKSVHMKMVPARPLAADYAYRAAAAESG